MWFTRTVAVVVASVFMMLICHSESKPQISGPAIALPADDEAFLGLLAGTKKDVPDQPATCDCPGSGQCKCVKIDMCCDQQPEDNSTPLFDERVFIDIGVRTPNTPCQEVDLLTVCCERECQEGKQLTNTGSANECGIRNNNGVRITISGFQDSQAQLAEFPWMVAVLTRDNQYVGGGSLVHSRVVLTAAHKVHDLKSSLIARIGDWNLNSSTELVPSQDINVKEVLIHPDFNRPVLENNVALLILQKDADLSDTVLPVCLPQSGQVFDGSDCIVTGWGKDVFGATGRYQTIMKKVSVPAVSHSDCQNMLRNTRLGSTFNLHSSFNCAGGLGEDACEGDGGSPLVCPNPKNPDQYVQMGVVAWGIGCGIVGNPGVYGSIPQTVDWINEKIQEVQLSEVDIRG